jgi:tyrosinase
MMSDMTSPAAKITDTIDMGTAYPGSLTIEEASSTMAGPFCYIYI